MSKHEKNISNLLESVFENTHTLIAYLDTDFNFLRVNAAYAETDKKNPDYFIGKNHFNLYPNNDNEIIFKSVLATGKTHFAYARPFEYEHNPERGITHWDWSLQPVSNGAGKIDSLILHLINVTERIQAEERLQIEKNFNTAVLNSANALVIVLDQDGRIIRFNPACERTTNFTFAEVKDRYIWDTLIADNDTDKIKRVFEEVKQETSHSEHINHIVAKNRTKKLIHWSNSIIRHSNSVSFTVSVGIDITEQRKSELALRESEERYQLAVRGSNDGIWDWDIISGTNYFSPRFRSLLGYDENDEFPQVYQSFLTRLHPDDVDHVSAAITNHIQNRAPYIAELRLQHANGEYLWFLMRGQAIWDETGKALRMAGSVTDINKRKQTEAELYKHREKLEDLVEKRTAKLHAAQKKLIQKERLATLGQLTATVSHEIRNPLAAIKPSLFIVNKLAASDNPQLTHAIERINRNINRCDHIIDELLDFTRITTLDTAKTNFDNWLSNTINDHMPPPGITTELSLNLRNLEVNIDPPRMQRVIINLVDNAIHAMTNESTGTIINDAYLTIKTEQFQNIISLTIADSGHGIPAENIEKIFEPLFSTKSFGVGLGMSAVKQIINDHKGTIAVNSAINIGSTFTITLPCDIQEQP